MIPGTISDLIGLVLIGGIIGINVFVVLLIGIVSGAVIALATGATGQTGILAVKALLENMGSGAAGMFETSMVAILVSAICALIREYGGFEALLGGELDQYPEAAFSMVGTVDEVHKKAKDMGAL